MKHTLLFLAANPLDTIRVALDEECAAIERELRMVPGRDDFEFRSKWAVSVDELMRHLNELQPTILHFSGHGEATSSQTAGILLQEAGRSQYVSDRALAKMIAAASPSTQVVVLNACHSATIVDSLRREVGCVVGMDGSLDDEAARSFAVAFYRALGNRRSVGNAVAQAVATLEAKQLADVHPVVETRDGARPDQVFLSTEDDRQGNPARPSPSSSAASPPSGTRVTREELFNRLSKLLSSQFESVLFQANVPVEHLSGPSASQAVRATETIRYFEQQQRLEDLARMIDRVMR